MADTDAFLRELHHRVKNNFQIIASLMSLQKRMLPADRRDDLRFIEEHVQCMAVAYRVVYATNQLIEVSIRELVREVLESLQQIAGPARNLIVLDMLGKDQSIGLNQAVALSLYLAVVVPPYLDHAKQRGGSFTVAMSLEDQKVHLLIKGDWGAPIHLDALRDRLAKAYVRQLNGELEPDGLDAETSVRFPLDVAIRHLA
jgi:two-component sensor histidine kinase